MINSNFSFELVDKYPPKTVIQNSLKQIEEATKGYVVGNIEDYDGPISSYLRQNVLALSLKYLNSPNEQIDIQDELGEISEEDYKYEVYISVPNLAHYKYRMMFVNHGTVSYPALIVMNDELAIEYNGKKEDTFTVTSMKELEMMMDKIICSDKMIILFQNLINESIRQENNQEVKYFKGDEDIKEEDI